MFISIVSRFKLAMASQPTNTVLDNEVIHFIGWSFLLIGSLLVLSSLYALGFYGTFLGGLRRFKIV